MNDTGIGGDPASGVQDRHRQGSWRLVALGLLLRGGENCGSTLSVSTVDHIIDSLEHGGLGLYGHRLLEKDITDAQ